MRVKFIFNFKGSSEKILDTVFEILRNRYLQKGARQTNQKINKHTHMLRFRSLDAVHARVLSKLSNLIRECVCVCLQEAIIHTGFAWSFCVASLSEFILQRQIDGAPRVDYAK